MMIGFLNAQSLLLVIRSGKDKVKFKLLVLPLPIPPSLRWLLSLSNLAVYHIKTVMTYLRKLTNLTTRRMVLAHNYTKPLILYFRRPHLQGVLRAKQVIVVALPRKFPVIATAP